MARRKMIKINLLDIPGLIKLYKKGTSPAELAAIFGYRRGGITNLFKRWNVLRTQSEASTLAVSQGKKDKAIKALILAAKTTNRFNPSKSHKGKDHPRWIKDRSKLKQERNKSEERWFYKEIIKDRGYKCELTKKGGRLSVHHIKPVWKYPLERFNNNNCIVIQTIIHKDFHTKYGLKSDELDWVNYIINKEYVPICQQISNA